MKQILFSLLLSLIFCSVINAQNLPNYLTDKEKEIYKNYIPPSGQLKDINPPPTPVRTMAEWEELQGTIITWVTSPTSYQIILRSIVGFAQNEGLMYIVCTDSNSVKSYLTAGGVPLTNLRFLITNFNSIWCRDYGPWISYSSVCDSIKIIDWIYNRPRPLDDVVPVFFANYMNLPIYQTTTAPNDLTATGGNFMVDGNGTGFSSKLILKENPGKTEAQIDTIMSKYMGLRRYIKMDTLPYDQIHHIDMHMKLLDEETIMVGQYPTGFADGPQIELNLQYILNNFQTCFGRPYKVVRIPMPPDQNGQYPPTGEYFTYTNSTFVNKTVIVPIYGVAQDTSAMRIYKENLPGYNVVSINCTTIIPSLGAIHCITKEIGAENPIFIAHPVLRNTSNTTTPYEVKAYIKNKSGIANAKVYWTTDTTAGFTQLNMTPVADTFKANIPNQNLGTKIYYYIKATANNTKISYKPFTAPVGYYKFMITNSVGITNNGTDLFYYDLYQNYPNPFNPVTKINYYLQNNGFVSLKVFDITGKQITQLINGNLNKGMHTISFDGSNFSSGIYFYTIETNGWKKTKAMILLK